MTFFDAPNEKGPGSFLAGPSVFFDASDQRAQPPKAPAGLVLSVFLIVLRFMRGGNVADSPADVKLKSRKVRPVLLENGECPHFHFRYRPAGMPCGVIRPLYQASINRMKSATE